MRGEAPERTQTWTLVPQAALELVGGTSPPEGTNDETRARPAAASCGTDSLTTGVLWVCKNPCLPLTRTGLPSFNSYSHDNATYMVT